MKVRPPQQVLEEKVLEDKTEDENDKNTLEKPIEEPDQELEDKSEDLNKIENSLEEPIEDNFEEPEDKFEDLDKTEDIDNETVSFEESINITDEAVVHKEKPSYTHQDQNSKITIYDDKPAFKDNTVIVKSQFPKSATSVECIITATGYKDKVIASGKELRLLQHRLYLIPVNTYEDSDEYSNIKIMSDMSDKIDVRYVKDGFACVTPLSHNVKIYDNIRLAVLS